MTKGKREELMELMRGIPPGESWLDALMQRLKEKEPLIYNYMIESARTKLKESTNGTNP
jgi:hypothetical protein